MSTFKENSRKNYPEDKPTHEGVRTGALQRIADACELMAKDRNELIKNLEYYKDLAEKRLQRSIEKDKEIARYKQSRTRYKNLYEKLKALKDSSSDQYELQEEDLKQIEDKGQSYQQI